MMRIFTSPSYWFVAYSYTGDKVHGQGNLCIGIRKGKYLNIKEVEGFILKNLNVDEKAKVGTVLITNFIKISKKQYKINQ